MDWTPAPLKGMLTLLSDLSGSGGWIGGRLGKQKAPRHARGAFSVLNQEASGGRCRHTCPCQRSNLKGFDCRRYFARTIQGVSKKEPDDVAILGQQNVLRPAFPMDYRLPLRIQY